MRIGIITLNLGYNFGGILQAYALQTVLERMGHKVSVINFPYRRRSPLWKMPFKIVKRILKKLLINRNTRILEERWWNRNYPIIASNTLKFVKRYVHRHIVKDMSEIKEGQFDGFVVGSDQVWRTVYYGGDIRDAYLRFAEGWNVKRVAYAPSFGKDTWSYTKEQTEDCARLLNLFDAVSVREVSGVRLIKEYLGVDAEHVLDPTLLLKKEDYIKLFEAYHTPKSKGTLLDYILDAAPEKTRLVETIARERGLVSFHVNSRFLEAGTPKEETIQPPVEEWLRGFYDSSYVVTDSFHACVFSIIFNKPFLALGNKGRGMSRFTSLLGMFGLESRLYDGVSIPDDDIDWLSVNNKLQLLRKKSFEFLQVLG